MFLYSNNCTPTLPSKYFRSSIYIYEKMYIISSSTKCIWESHEYFIISPTLFVLINILNNKQYNQTERSDQTCVVAFFNLLN